MKISDEIRQWCGEDSVAHDELFDMADRIDRETVELPKDFDGVPIHVGDTVYTSDGGKANVFEIYIMQHTMNVVCMFSDGGSIVYAPHELSHECPDSLELIADELEDWSENNRVNGVNVNGEICGRAAAFADRIRKLAKEGEE